MVDIEINVKSLMFVCERGDDLVFVSISLTTSINS